ncbi:MAG: DUF559 domain-containing protein [Candidatus Dormibacteraeota bacterium]|nr:DUF559 domain-containing protein [Candidatus Dormibacteraeota bacterium]
MILAAVCRRLPLGSVFSGRTAAYLHGLDIAPCDPVEATIPSPFSVSARAGVCLRRADLADDDVANRRGLPVTSAVRTVADLGGRDPLTEAVVAVDMALHKRLVDRSQLRAYADAHRGRSGVARLRRARVFAEPASESPMETRLRMLLVLAGLPRPQVQVPLRDAWGRFLARADLYYPAQGLALEYDGGTHRESLVQDDRRQNQLMDAGYRLLRFTAADVFRAPDTVVALVRGTLAARKRVVVDNDTEFRA